MNKSRFSFKSKFGIRKSKEKTQFAHNVNAKGLYYKKMTKTKQDHDKNMYPKLILNKLKIMWDFIPIEH
jgi:hypothetical protein